MLPFTQAQHEWWAHVHKHTGEILKDLLKIMGLIKHPSPAIKQLLATQGSDKVWQVLATSTRAEQRGLTDKW